jgi:hypothetical protein
MLGQIARVDEILTQHQWLSARLWRKMTPPTTCIGTGNRVAARRFRAVLRDVHFANQTGHSSQECDCFPDLMSESPTPVIAVPLASLTATACAMHAANLPTLDCGCAAWLSGPLRGSVAPGCQIDQVHGVVAICPLFFRINIHMGRGRSRRSVRFPGPGLGAREEVAAEMALKYQVPLVRRRGFRRHSCS